ncbi:ParA family protein [Bernardetia sp. MNP-M8]|uniref:ParA family protein n=1 Tax=Bernardetia sp. MNP-M8 TaxID=3127470 RepID=UPI0030D486AD
MKHGITIAFVNHKGGVGKTTSVHQIGASLVQKGFKVLLVDNDPQANLTFMNGWNEENETTIYDAIAEGNENLPVYEISENLFLTPSELDYASLELQLPTDPLGHFALRTILENQKKEYDFVLIDNPPTLGVFVSNALFAADKVVIITESSSLSAKGLQVVVDLIQKLKKGANKSLELLGLVLTKTSNYVVRRDTADWIREQYDVFETGIRQTVSLEEAAALQQNIFDYNPKSSGAEDYQNLTNELLKKLNIKPIKGKKKAVKK